MRKPPLRFGRAEEDTGERQPRITVRVVGDDAELAQRVFGRLGGVFGRGSRRVIGDVSVQETSRERVVQVGRGGAGHDGLVETDDPALAAFLEQPGKGFRSHLAPAAADPAEVSAWALVHEQAARDVDAQHRYEPPSVLSSSILRMSASSAGFTESLQMSRTQRSRVSMPSSGIPWTRRVLSSTPRTTVPPRLLARAGQLVREVTALGAFDAAAGHKNALELQRRVLAEADAAEAGGLVSHRALRRSWEFRFRDSLPSMSCIRRLANGESCIPGAYIAFTIPSTIFFASENSIMVLSRKNSSFSIPA